jgi:hypothetical protein
MKRFFAFFVLAVFVTASSARASVTLQVGDGVKYLGQISGESVGYGGAFNWQVTSVVPSPASSPIGTNFQSFCVELQQSISTGNTYTVSNVFAPTVGQAINTSGNLLNNYKGIYLFDEWNDGTMTQNSANAGAVQIGLWESEGYNLTANNNALLNTAGYTVSNYNSAEGLISYWLGKSLQGGSTYSASWTPTNVNAVELTHYGDEAQDQIVLVPTSAPGGSGSIPEPTSMAVWGIVVLLAGAAAMRRRKSA